MTRWQRRARTLIALVGAGFAVFLVRQFKPVDPAPAAPRVVRTDPRAVIETTGCNVLRFTSSREVVSIKCDKQFTYADGSTKLTGVTLASEEKDGDGGFTARAKDASVAKDQSTIVLNGDVQLVSSAVHARTEHATYTKGDNTIRGPGPAEITEGRTTASGIGLTFDRTRDVLSILDRAVVHVAPDDKGGSATDITSVSVTFARRERYRRFEKNVRLERGGQRIEADTAVAYMSEDGARIETFELRGGARIKRSTATPGGLKELTGQEMNLKYGADGQSLEHALITGEAVIQVAGEPGKGGRQIAASSIDVVLAPDGVTPTALTGRGAVQLTFPPEPGAPGQTIKSTNLDARGQPGRGLTHALFSGSVQYREQSADVNRAASAAALDVGLTRGMGSIEDAKFSRGVRFEEGRMGAQAAVARYDLGKGTLELSGSEPGAVVPHMVNEQIVVDAAKIDVTLAGPKVVAAGNVRSQLLPAKKAGKPGEAANDVKMPAMLKQDQTVIVVADALDYDGTRSLGTYTGSARLFQGDTSIKGETIVIDDKSGDLSASGGILSTTLLDQGMKDKNDKSDNKKERVHSTATAKDLKYEDAERRLTYTGDAHMSGPEGDMTATKIELYLKPSGDELDRAEAYEAVTLREQNRNTTGARMTYTTADEKYVITGVPVRIVDGCKRETTGRTLTFLKATDSIVVDGNQQVRTQTKGGGKCP